MKGLKAFYRQKELIEHYTDLDVSNWLGDFNEIEKELKALEIIKKKVMKLVTLEDNTVWDNSRYDSVYLTRNEFDLLREVLG